MKRTKICLWFLSLSLQILQIFPSEILPHDSQIWISVCKEWSDSFVSFYEWSKKNGYQEGLTIDRINSNGNYCPENCRWVTTAIQNRNYSRNHFLTYNGETLCLKDMAEKYGVKPTTLLFRLKSGMALDLALQNIDRRSLRFK